MTKPELNSTLTNLQSQLTEIYDDLKNYESQEEQADELEATHVILTGIEKMCISNMVLYYEMRVKLDHGCTVHPESMNTLEKLQYSMDHNLPVKREYLYELAPHLFTYEIGEMKRIVGERYKPKSIKLLDRPPGEDVYLRHWKPSSETISETKEKYKPALFKLQDQAFEEEGILHDYLERKGMEWALEFADYFEAKFEEGWTEFDDVLCVIENKDPILRTETEQDIVRGVIVLRRIWADYKDLRNQNIIKQSNSQWEQELPEYIRRNPKLMTHFEQVHQYVLKNAKPWEDSILAPESPEELGEYIPPKVEDIIESHKKTEVEKLIEQSQQEFKRQTIAGDVIKPDTANIHEKDPRLLERLNILGDVLHIIEDTEKDRVSMQKSKLANKFQHDMLDFKPEESKILLREFTKVLALNNKDPMKFDIKFWAAYFNIRPQKQKNIFNFVSYPVVEDGEVVRVLRFINFDE